MIQQSSYFGEEAPPFLPRDIVKAIRHNYLVGLAGQGARESTIITCRLVSPQSRTLVIYGKTEHELTPVWAVEVLLFELGEEKEAEECFARGHAVMQEWLRNRSAERIEGGLS